MKPVAGARTLSPLGDKERRPYCRLFLFRERQRPRGHANEGTTGRRSRLFGWLYIRCADGDVGAPGKAVATITPECGSVEDFQSLKAAACRGGPKPRYLTNLRGWNDFPQVTDSE